MGKYILYRDVVKAKLSGNMKRLNESSLSRIWQYVQDAPRKSIAIITAFRKYDDTGKLLRTRADNMKRNDELMNYLRGRGYGPTRLIGHWQECKDPNIDWDKCPKEMKIDTKEVSYAVIGITLKEAHELGNKYLQDAITYLGPETKGKAALVFRSGKIDTIGKGDFSPAKIAQAYSEIRGRPFTFEGFELRPETWVDALTEMALTKLAKLSYKV